MKKLLSILMVLVLMMSVFSFSCVSNATENDDDESVIMPRWTTISHYTAGMDISGLTATVSASLTAGYKTNLKIVVPVIKIPS